MIKFKWIQSVIAPFLFPQTGESFGHWFANRLLHCVCLSATGRQWRCDDRHCERRQERGNL